VIPVPARSVSAEPHEQELPSYTPLPSDWVANHPLMRGMAVPKATEPLQAKLTIGEPGDKYEQEADAVAAQVVGLINSPAPAPSPPGQSVQRQEENEEELQTKPEITALQRQEENEEELQTKLEITALQRQEENKEELQAKSTLQRGEAIGGGEATPDLDTAINSSRGGGQPLDAGLQQSMGQAMGADFSGVRVHTDARSDQLNQSIQAKAFTTGQDVFFRQGAYDPASRGGQELIAHELTHVVQQNGGAVQRSACSESILQRRDAIGCGEASTDLASVKNSARGGEQPLIQLLKDSEITSTKGANGASKNTVKYLKRKRPSYESGQVEAVWNAAPKDQKGRAICPNTGIKISWTPGTLRQGIWDMGHKSGHEYKTLWEKLAKSEINYDKFIEEYQNPNNYQVEDPSANRSHKFQAE